MKSSKKDDQHLQDLLKQLPYISDTTDKDELLARISQKPAEKDSPKRKRNTRHIPVFVSLLTTIIILVIVPFALYSSSPTEEKSSYNEASDQATSVESGQHGDESGMVAEEFATEQGSPKTLSDKPLESHVLQNKGEKSIMYGTIQATIGNNVIPLALVLPETQEGIGLDVVKDYLQEQKWGIDAETFQTAAQPVTDKASYYLFRAPGADRGFLIPIVLDTQTSIAAALNEMKQNREASHVYRTIPTEIQFSVSTENQLEITLSNNAALPNTQEGITMIDAILMTAKSFGYASVTFHNTKVNQIGDYDLSKPIKVPKAVNPITIDR
ncbi:hypothetical protein GCM10011409_08960 [Lentibacillus populi]|uniref:GerMN domain-containing protein n=1 Tax=Lentibacillus populi TaxID=1827502 RepID=A0A9W5X4S1_9BACI|nr:hypothetical protein [Lentibacillus populi]GGB33741.1 hypothetical protein GCM10011409_08960 [Lentibacillus populi]